MSTMVFPHLLIPVVTDPKKGCRSSHWAVTEMMDRYEKFADAGVRDMKGYNAKIKNGTMKINHNGQMVDVAVGEDTPGLSSSWTSWRI